MTRLVSIVEVVKDRLEFHWANAAFTLGVAVLTPEDLLKIAAFLFVTLPLGIVQWWSLLDKWRKRYGKGRHASD